MELSRCLNQKRIWEVDCVSLDAALAASLDWKDLVNILHSHGIEFSDKGKEDIVEIQAQNLIHRYCHSMNPISLQLENLLNYLHSKRLEQIQGMSSERALELLQTIHMDKTGTHLGGLFWAFGVDSRQEFDCFRRRFHQRYQITSLRQMRAV